MIQHKHISWFLVAALSVAILAACSSPEKAVEGTYSDSMDLVTIELKDGKATATILGESEKEESTYKVEGDIITFQDKDGSARYRRNQDGSITGPLDGGVEQITLLKKN